MPLLAGGLVFEELPGPLSGCHSVKLADKNGMVQALEEIVKNTGSKKRGSAKVDAALNKLVETAREYEAAEGSHLKTDLNDRTGGGLPFEVLYSALLRESIDASQVNGKGMRSLLELSMDFAHWLATGVSNSESASEMERAVFHHIASRLVVYGLAEHDKLPGSISWKRLVLSNKGKEFILRAKVLREQDSPTPTECRTQPESRSVGRGLEPFDLALVEQLVAAFPGDEVHRLFRTLEGPRHAIDRKLTKRMKEKADRFLAVDRRFRNTDLESSKKNFLMSMKSYLSFAERRSDTRNAQEDVHIPNNYAECLKSAWEALLCSVRSLEPDFSWPDKNPSFPW